MPSRVYLPMNPKQRDELRHAMEIQFRYKFYNRTEFPFLQSIGVNHIIQGFEAPDELGYIGVLHLWWVSDPTGTVLGIWESEWLDNPEEAIQLSIQIQERKPYDENKLVHIAMEYAKEAANKHVEKLVEDHLEEEEKPPKLLN